MEQKPWQGHRGRRVEARAVLTGYMMVGAGRARQMFGRPEGAVERGVAGAAEAALGALEAACGATVGASAGGGGLWGAAGAALAAYGAAYEAWRAADAAELEEQVRGALMGLYSGAAAGGLAAAAAADPGVVEALAAAVERTRERLAQLGGPEAVARVDEERTGAGAGAGAA